jgi:hypothetical protein
MTLVDRILKVAADLHAKRHPAPVVVPPRMPFTAPARDYTDSQACVTCAIVWDALDVLGRSMPADTNLDHFLQAIGQWWVATLIAGDKRRVPLLVEMFMRILSEEGIPAFLSAVPTGTRPPDGTLN